VQAAIDQTVKEFGGIDILVNNASAINLNGTEALPMKRYDLMQSVNTRGTFLCSKLAVPHLKKADNPHVLTLSPPLNLNPHWFANNVAYTISKYGMSMVTLGMAEEFKDDGIAFNALWPRTTIATAAVNNLLGGDEMMQKSRTPAIMADSAYIIFMRNSREHTGNFYIDDEVLQAEGVTDFSKYRVDPDLSDDELMPDFFLD